MLTLLSVVGLTESRAESIVFAAPYIPQALFLLVPISKAGGSRMHCHLNLAFSSLSQVLDTVAFLLFVDAKSWKAFSNTGLLSKYLLLSLYSERFATLHPVPVSFFFLLLFGMGRTSARSSPYSEICVPFGCFTSSVGSCSTLSTGWAVFTNLSVYLGLNHPSPWSERLPSFCFFGYRTFHFPQP